MFEYTDYLSSKSIEPVRETNTDNVVREINGRWFIRMGFAGYNTHANNRNGYTTRAKALATVRKYQTTK